jgi:hypothetical protein
MKRNPPKEKGGSTENAHRLKSNRESISDQASAVNTYGTHATKSEKIKATLKAKAEKFKSQTIKVDENWSIVRLEEMNSTGRSGTKTSERRMTNGSLGHCVARCWRCPIRC